MPPERPAHQTVEEAAREWAYTHTAPEHVENRMFQSFLAGARFERERQLTEEERAGIAYELCKEDGDRIETPYCKQYCELAARSFKKRCPYLGAADAAYSALQRLRSTHG